MRSQVLANQHTHRLAIADDVAAAIHFLVSTWRRLRPTRGHHSAPPQGGSRRTTVLDVMPERDDACAAIHAAADQFRAAAISASHAVAESPYPVDPALTANLFHKELSAAADNLAALADVVVRLSDFHPWIAEPAVPLFTDGHYQSLGDRSRRGQSRIMPCH